MFWRSNRWGVQHAVRQGSWKYLRIDTPQARMPRRDTGEFLFDLQDDPREMQNLATSRPEVLDRLRRLYADWESGVLPAIEPVPAPPRPASTNTRTALP